MLNAKQIERYADVLLWGMQTARGEVFRKQDTVLLRYDLPALALAEAVYARLLDRGLNAVVRSTLTPAMERTFYMRSNRRQLVYRTPGDDTLYQHLNGGIYLHAPAAITHLATVDPKRIAKTTLSRRYLKDILDARDQAGRFGWTLCLYPTEELARKAEMSVDDYARQVIKACYLNRTDPLGHWRSIHRRAGEIKKRLNRLAIRYLHIESAGVDLKIVPGKQRRWIGISGHNIPSFEIFVSPDWRGTCGVYFADQPSFRSGNLVRGVRLVFERGRAVKITATQGQKFARGQFAMDAGACRVGEFSLTDRGFSKIDRFMANTLYDENFGGRYGNCHIALGSSYADAYDGDAATLDAKRKRTLGFNQSALHWDLVNTEKKRVTAHLSGGDRTVIYEKGRFVL